MAKAQWTVMVYMAAGKDAELDNHAITDLMEMERAHVGDHINVVAQIDRFWPSKPQRYRILEERTELVRADVVDGEPIGNDAASLQEKDVTKPAANMGFGATLSDFMLWSATQYPAEHYFLVLWGHAYGLGFGRDHGEPMTLVDLTSAIGEFNKVAYTDRSRPEDQKLELLGANACAMSYAEAAFQLKDLVQRLVASEIAVPFAGWPYDAILGHLSRTGEKTGVAMEVKELGNLVIDRYVGQFAPSSTGDRLAMSQLDLTHIGDFQSRFNALVDGLVGAVESTDGRAGERRAHIRAAFMSTAAGDVRPLLDLFDLCQRLEAMCDDLLVFEPKAKALVDLKEAATALKSFLAPGKPFLFSQRHPDLEGLFGLGVFAPFVTSDKDLTRLGLSAEKDTGRDAYEKLALMQGSRWPALVYDDLRAGLPSDVLATIEGSGASIRADRSAVAQMLAAVDSTFDTLDLRIAATCRRAAANVPALAGASKDHHLAPEKVNLLGTLQLLRHEALDRMIAAATQPVPLARVVGEWKPPSALPSGALVLPPPTPAGTDVQVEETANAFLLLERMVGDVERTIRRTLTNGTFGLGPGLGAEGDKAGLGAEGDKAGLGAEGDKAGLGAEGDKAGLGAEGDKAGLGAPGAEVEPTPGQVVGGLFAQVARALRRLEDAAGEAETVAAKALLGPSGSSAFEPLSNVTQARTRIDRAFRTLSDASADARRTLKRVLAHPTYGFGPGPRDIDAESRRSLAMASGLSSERLKLL